VVWETLQVLESVDRLLELLDRAQDILPELHRSIHMAAGHLCDLAWPPFLTVPNDTLGTPRNCVCGKRARCIAT
jgi:hypothetical protein